MNVLIIFYAILGILPGRDNNLALGNPSNACVDKNNYLIQRDQYTLSYSDERGTPNWVSWHSSYAWKGYAKREDVSFKMDTVLGKSFNYVVNPNDYSKSGFDRGHLCPSNERDFSIADISSTFFMTNIIPQAPKMNQGVWHSFERYCQDLINKNYELYIISGAYGEGGIIKRDNKYVSVKKIKNRITVPSHVWKIVVILPVGENDLKRIDKNTKVLAINVPNREDLTSKRWETFKVTIDNIECLTGYDFMSNVPKNIQAIIESK